MAASITHRGPDDSGTFVGGAIGLANRRLAIIDLSPAGHQPMTSDDGALRARLQRRALQLPRAARASSRRAGTRSARATDTEVVLRAYEEWGPACLERFNGMFAFAVWDARERELFARARPLRRSSRSTTPRSAGGCCSAPRSRRCSRPACRARVSPDGARRVLHLPERLLRPRRSSTACACCRPGTCSVAARDGVGGRALLGPRASSPDESCRRATSGSSELRAALRGGGRRGSSSATCRSAATSRAAWTPARSSRSRARRIPRLMTFTGGFDLASVNGLELVFDERADAERVASAFSTEHYEMVMHAGDMAWVLPELVWHLEDLRVGMCYQNHYIARLASKFVTVSLGGHRRRRALRRLPVALRPGRGRRRPGRVRARLLRLLEPPRPRRPSTADFFAPRACGRPSTAVAVRRLPRRARPGRAPRPASRRRCTSRRRRSCTACSSSRTASRWRTASRCACRSSTTSSSRSRAASRSRLQARERRRQAAPARGDARICSRTRSLEKRKQGFSPPDESWYRGPDDGRTSRSCCSTRGRSTAGTSSRRSSAACSTSTRDGRDEPPAADLVAALLRVVEPALHRRRAEDAPQRLARRHRAVRRRRSPPAPRGGDRRHARPLRPVRPRRARAHRATDGAAASARSSSGARFRSSASTTPRGPTGWSGTGARRSSTARTGFRRAALRPRPEPVAARPALRPARPVSRRSSGR